MPFIFLTGQREGGHHHAPLLDSFECDQRSAENESKEQIVL